MTLNRVDRLRVKGAFHRRAGSYDGHARVQKRVVDRLAGILAAEKGEPSRLLDVGTGTGMLMGRLRELYPRASAWGIDLAFNMCRTAMNGTCPAGAATVINADAESLPLRGGAFDLVVSASVFQWLAAPDAAFAEAYRVTMPGGRFCFAMFGGRTLHELRSSYGEALSGLSADACDPTHSFLDVEQVADALRGAGFAAPEVFSELEAERHPDVQALLKALKGIGAGNASPERGAGLAGRSVMLRMMEIYRERFGKGGEIPATYEVIYGHCRKNC